MGLTCRTTEDWTPEERQLVEVILAKYLARDDVIDAEYREVFVPPSWKPRSE
jgi:hypothetical protein